MFEQVLLERLGEWRLHLGQVFVQHESVICELWIRVIGGDIKKQVLTLESGFALLDLALEQRGIDRARITSKSVT